METYSHDIRKLLKIAAGVCIVLGLFLAIETVKSFKEYGLLGANVPAQHTITVRGEGEAFAKPDRAHFTFSIIEEASTVQDAQQQATQREERALETLRDAGIEEKNIRTIRYNLNPRYEYPRNTVGRRSGTRVLAGFEIRQTVEVKTDDIAAAGKLIGGLGEIGVQDISGLSFEVSDEDAVRSQARTQAIEEARAKAERLADELDVKLTRIVSFNESGSVRPHRFEAMSANADLGRGGGNPEIPSGENRIVERVSVTYEIR